jgi:hypothetical protein
MREHVIRAGFSFLAAAVTLSMAGEWASWAVEQRKCWKLAPATFLVGMAIFEANQVRHRGEHIVGLRSNGLVAGQ